RAELAGVEAQHLGDLAEEGHADPRALAHVGLARQAGRDDLDADRARVEPALAEVHGRALARVGRLPHGRDLVLGIARADHEVDPDVERRAIAPLARAHPADDVRAIVVVAARRGLPAGPVADEEVDRRLAPAGPALGRR